MFGKLFLLFTLVPMIELWLLFQLEGQIGWVTTIWIVLLTGMLGASMAKQQGMKVIQDLQSNLQQGIPPTNLLAEGLLVLVGGVLLITPGVMTDAFGFSLIIPFTRKLWVPFLTKVLASKIKVQSPLHHQYEHAYSNETPFSNTSTNPDIQMKDPHNPEKKKFSHPKF